MNPLVFFLALQAALPSLVSPPWKTVQVPEELAAFYADHFAQALRKEGFQVVTSSELNALLSLDRQKQLLGCSEDSTSCVAELGAALGCDAVMLVNLAKLENLYRGQLKVVSSKDGAVWSETAVEAEGQRALLGALEEGAHRLARGLSPVAIAPSLEVKAANGSRRWWWVPAVVAGAGAVTAAVGFGSASSRYNSLKTELTDSGLTSQAQTMATDGKTMQTIGWLGAGIATAGALGVAGLLLFGSEPKVEASISVNMTGGTLTVKGTFR